MTMLKEANPEGGAYSKLKEVGVHKWARSQCPILRYSFLTSNLAESFNNRLLWARRLSICSMIEAIRHIVEKRFDKRHEAAKKYPGDMTPEAIRKIRVEIETSRRYQVVVGVDELTFKDHQGHNISQYMGVYYEASALAQAYSYRVHPVPPQDCWMIPTEVAEIRFLPPATIRQAGRPRTRRHRGPTERTSKTRRSNAVHGASSSRSRASRTCDVCGSISHTRRGCPYLERAPPLDKFIAFINCTIPGELICGPGLITTNMGRKGIVLKVTNTGYMPIQTFSSGAMFSLVSGMGGQNAVTVGLSFALIQGGDFQIAPEVISTTTGGPEVFSTTTCDRPIQ
ncbi:hypothetical protein OROMI_011331 [Orobanche minor]